MKKIEEAQTRLVELQNHALQQALRDPVTRMPNDSFLMNRINELVQTKHIYESFALVLLYFPQLKEISSSMGRRLADDLFASIIKGLNEELTNNIQTVVVDSESESGLAVLEFGSLVFIFGSATT